MNPALDWSDGHYELTAKSLEPAARVALDALGALAGAKLLDLGCGTGNVALEAAKRGALVTAVDPAPRLLAVTRERAASADLQLTALDGDAARIPAEAATFDVAISVFAVIFAPDAADAAAELVRVVRPGGRIVITAWQPFGPIFEAGMVLRRTMGVRPTMSPAQKAPRWADPAFVRELFAPYGARAECTDHDLSFETTSVEAWFDEQCENHPVWRAGKRLLDANAWDRLRTESIDAMRAATRDPVRLTSPYVQYVITR